MTAFRTLALAFAAIVGIVAAQPAPPTTVPNRVTGGRAGDSVIVSWTGSNLNQPLHLWSLPRLNSTLQLDGAAVNSTIAIPLCATTGPSVMRLAAAGVWQPPRVFASDAWLETKTESTNRSLQTSQNLLLPTVVSGHVETESSRFFRFALKQRQRVAIDALARRLGSPCDPVLIVHDVANQREVRGGVVDDTPGLWGDCRLALTLDKGEYVIEMRDSLYRGGPDHVFRLRIGDVALPTAAMPMAVRRGQTIGITFYGNGCSPSSTTVSAPADPGIVSLFVSPTPDAWPVPLLVSDMEELVELEPNDSPANAIDLPIPCGLTGQFLTRGDKDWYRLRLKKDEKVKLQVWAAELGSPADVLLTIRNADGKELVATDPGQLTTKLEFAAPADGDYFVIAEHVNLMSGPEQVYRLTVQPAAGFELTLPQLTAEVSLEGNGELKVKVTRTGYDGPIELTAHGVEGRLSVAQGKAGDVAVPVKAATAGPLTVRVVGRASINGRDVMVTAQGRDVLKAALSGWPDPPPDWCAAIAVTTKPAAKADGPESKNATKKGKR